MVIFLGTLLSGPYEIKTHVGKNLPIILRFAAEYQNKLLDKIQDFSIFNVVLH